MGRGVPAARFYKSPIASARIGEMDEKQAIEAAKLLQAFAHPKRLLLLSVLYGRKMPAARLADAIGLPPGMVYKHLHKLVATGVLSVTVSAAGTQFSIASPELALKILNIEPTLLI